MGRVQNFWCVVDCGIAAQPDNIVAQFEGGIVFGLGLALNEEISIRDGVVQQNNFYDYRVMRMNDVPEIHVEVISTDNHPTGVGQMSVVMVAPAVANAVARLTGVRLREAPMTPERVKKALGQSGSSRGGMTGSLEPLPLSRSSLRPALSRARRISSTTFRCMRRTKVRRPGRSLRRSSRTR
jgi:hypothetical protein